MSDLPEHGIWESVYVYLEGGGLYRGGSYRTICKVCYQDAPHHKPDCEFDALHWRAEAAEDLLRQMRELMEDGLAVGGER